MKRARTSPVGWPGQGASPRLPKPDNPAVALRSVDRLEVPCNRPTQDGSATVPPSIARGLFREHDTILLDEPTASIDPLEEQAVYYERFMKIAARRTAIIVTHRLASARLADRILVLDGGRIVEDGSHEELLARRGLYHRMFTAQAAWYRRS